MYRKMSIQSLSIELKNQVSSISGVWKWPHIPFFGQVFQSGMLMVLPFGVLASEFSVEAKNISRFAGECHELFAKISKGGPH